jgi:hypothetical protein
MAHQVLFVREWGFFRKLAKRSQRGGVERLLLVRNSSGSEYLGAATLGGIRLASDWWDKEEKGGKR